jgi:hypothetical protein
MYSLIAISSLMFSAYTLSACHATNRNLTIKISAKTPAGTPVAAASVFIDGKLAGETNAFGSIQVLANLSNNSRHLIRVSKSDEKYYFAPHIESLKITKKTPDEVSVTSTMYLVPKPKKNLAAEPSPALEKSVPPHNQNPVDDAQKIDSPALAVIPEIKSPTSQNEPTSAPKTMLNVHVYSGRLALPKAKVTWVLDSLSASCESNERGRCLLEIPTHTTGNASIVVFANGYQASTITAPLNAKDNVRISLKTGSNYLFRVVKKSTWSLHPIASATVGCGSANSTTDAQGLVALSCDSPTTQGIFSVSVKNSSASREIKSQDLDSLVVNEIPFASNEEAYWKNIYSSFFRIMPSAASLTSAPLPLSEILDSLSETSELNGVHLTQNKDNLGLGSLDLVPVISSKAEKYMVAWYRHIKDRQYASLSAEFEISNPSLKSAWKTALTASLQQALTKSPSPAIIIKASQSKIEVSGKQLFDMPSEINFSNLRVASASPENVINFNKIERTQTGYKIDLAPESQSQFSKPWNHIGRVVWMTPKQGEHLIDLTPLQSLDPTFAMIQRARKLMDEGNAEELAKEFSSHEEVANSSQVVALRHSFLQQTGKHAELMKDLYKLINESYGNNQIDRAINAEISLLRVQTEIIPVIMHDKDIIEKLSEVIARCDSLKNEMNATDALTLVNLKYTALLAARKRAQISDDLVTMATLKSDLDQIMAILQQTPDHASWKENWIKTARIESKYLEFEAGASHKTNL